MNDGKRLELEVQQLLKRMGLDAEITGYSQDGGIDIVAINLNPVSGGRYVIQCKDWGVPVGEPAIRDLFGTMHSEGANKGILITTSSFTAAAQRFAQGKPLELIDGTTYDSLCKQYGIVRDVPATSSATEDVFQPGTTSVRLISVDSIDPTTRAEFRHFVFSVGTLTIGSELEYVSPGIGSFGFGYYRILQVSSSETAAAPTARFEVSFTDDFLNAPCNMTFEGRPEVIRTLYSAANLQIAKHLPKAGCLRIFTVLTALAITAGIIIWSIRF
ncbi:MAG: restriction endonuclease [Verrucomicrobia bacterium]|nr:restriction endonuclease [Verrucomicrobiota bacterium]